MQRSASMPAHFFVRSRFVALIVTLTAACASGPKVYSTRIIDRPSGERIVPGAARNTSYMARVSMEHNIAHISVMERSVCPTIRVMTVNRIEEMLDGDKIVQRVDKGPHEVAETQPTMMECEARFARVALSLQYGSETYPLGATSEYGRLDADLASAMKVNTRGIDLSTKTGLLLIGDAPVAEISIAGLLQQQQRVDAIVGQLSSVLGKGGTKLSDADANNAAMLYQELLELAPDDARTTALSQRFGEVVGGFRELQKTESLKRNLSALSDAKELLAALSKGAALPSFVHLSVANEQPSTEALAWARAQALVALRRDAALLCAGGFDWARVSQLSESSRVAFAYLRYAFDANDLGWLSSACAR